MWLETVGLGLAVILITAIGKRYNVDQKYVALALAIILGIAYTAFTLYVPEVSQQNIILFVTSVTGTAKIIYDVVTAIKTK